LPPHAPGQSHGCHRSDLEETPDLGIMVRDENGKILFEVNAFVWTQEPPNPPHLN
jgi:hypothetical protein